VGHVVHIPVKSVQNRHDLRCTRTMMMMVTVPLVCQWWL
jgi:hypothetical protein